MATCWNARSRLPDLVGDSMRLTSNIPSGSVIYSEGRLGKLAFPTPRMGVLLGTPTSSRALEYLGLYLILENKTAPPLPLEHSHLIPHLINLNRNPGSLGQACLALPGPLPRPETQPLIPLGRVKAC